jgi:hypothetical protein
MIKIVVTFIDGPPTTYEASYTKVRGSFFCIHFPTRKEGSKEKFDSKFIPLQQIKEINQTSDKAPGRDFDNRYPGGGDD